MADKYYVISGSEDGDVGIHEYNESQLLKRLEEYEDYLPRIITNLKDNNDLMYWGDSILIIKGNIKVPKPEQIVKKWGI
jgi:hypothetical protein